MGLASGIGPSLSSPFYGELDSSTIHFAPGGAGSLDFDKQAVQARVCRDCGLLQPFVEKPGELE
ncbi:MAG: hypothetical protein ABEN55_10015 [Bradymonadaceae bacterium]